jgi:hypothetical protein
MHAQYDARETTQAARDAFRQKFVNQVDPNGELPEDECARRAESARKAHMKRLAFKSVKARRQRSLGRPLGKPADVPVDATP